MASILVVDDDGFVRDLLTVVLEAEGHEVRTAKDGEEALPHLAVGLDVVVTDKNMPRLGGLELIGRVRSSGLSVRSVLLSGDEGDRGPARAAGADLFLLKDENLQDLIGEAVRRTLEEAGP